MGSENIKPFLKECGKDVTTSQTYRVHIYSKAGIEANRDFNLQTQDTVKQFLVDLKHTSFHHHKEDILNAEIWKIPKGTVFDVFYFDYKTSRAGYLAIIKQGIGWIIKSLKKNDSPGFVNNALAEAFKKNEEH